jgi:hypothetical protein
VHAVCGQKLGQVGMHGQMVGLGEAAPADARLVETTKSPHPAACSRARACAAPG